MGPIQKDGGACNDSQLHLVQIRLSYMEPDRDVRTRPLRQGPPWTNWATSSGPALWTSWLLASGQRFGCTTHGPTLELDRANVVRTELQRCTLASINQLLPSLASI